MNALTETPPDEEVEAGSDELILLRYSRLWPHSAVEWTRRRRNSGSQSFPLRSGVVRSDSSPPDWGALRDDALAAAGASPQAASADHAKTSRKSIWGRLTARR